MRYLLILLVALSCFGPANLAQAQSSSEDRRRVVRKVEPQYPQAAKRMNLGGTVKVIVVVAADGNVKKVEPIGGSPLLVDAAQSAVAQWKYAPGAETREVVELHFTP
ncbi:MAG TPA: energy transducer TonB [Candidatus Dormibacteraeota bacterium]|nr:energy transducer TonB [Candidatus Dormibacteraeota bacterium]